MKRVLIVNTVNTGFNGITSMMMNYVRKTCNLIQYDFVLCGFVEKTFEEEIIQRANKVMIPPCSRVKNFVLYYFWLKNILRTEHYDAIHVHGNSGTMYIEIKAAKIAGVPIRIAHCHSTSCKYKLAHKLLKSKLNNCVTNAVACSQQAGKWLYNGEFTILHNGIDVQKFSFSKTERDKYRRELNLEEVFVIGHIGYMSHEKNHTFLLSVFKRFLDKVPSAHLVLIGDGNLRHDIEKYIEDNNLQERVSILGNRADVAQLYQAFDVFVLPSLWEGLPVTLVEAQTAGLPCIASDTVTPEVNITGNVRYVGIGEKDIDSWIKELLSIKDAHKERSEWNDHIVKSKFNIGNGISELLDIYNG